MGRPLKRTADCREDRIEVRLTKEERARIDEQAKQAGMSRSDYVRNMVLNGQVTVKHTTVDFHLIHELNKIGVNLNQLVHAAHIRGKLPQSLPAICAEIENLVAQAAEEVNA